MKGLRLADPVAEREKRLPFNDGQLTKIFTAPLYSGCRDDSLGYSTSGSERPKGTRYWIPLIGLYSGLRLNEICQLDTTDVRALDGVMCFVISTKSLIGTTDKSLQTRSSERIVPVHPRLLELGLARFLAQRSSADERKIFNDVSAGRNGYRSVAFSKWFSRFLQLAGAAQERTSFHSFRHRFRDALREARIDRDVSLAIGGWGTSKDAGNVADNYGRGFSSKFLFNEVSKVQFPAIDGVIAMTP